MLRRVRAAVIIIAVWLVCWVPFAVGLDHVISDMLFPAPRIDSPYTPLRVWAIWGAFSGFGFAVVLALGERGRAAASLSIFRVLSWGAIGGALVPLFYMIITAAVGSASLGFYFHWWPWVLLTIAESAVLGLCSALGVLALLRANTA